LVPSSDDWQEFEGTSEARSLLGGAGNVDDNLLELPAGSYRGCFAPGLRFIVAGITPSSGRRERALSSDAGKTWEVNWVMEFRARRDPRGLIAMPPVRYASSLDS
jgi:hypothetical protein